MFCRYKDASGSLTIVGKDASAYKRMELPPFAYTKTLPLTRHRFYFFMANRLCTIGFDMFTNNSSIESTHVHFVHFAIYANHWNSTERGGGGHVKEKYFYRQ